MAVRYLILVLEGLLAAYGAEMVDARGPVRAWPGASMLSGLIANALGFSRGMGAKHATLQARLDFAVRLDRPGELLREFQTVQLVRSSQGWTTRGLPEGRAGSEETYRSPHIRERDYYADSGITVAVGLRGQQEQPDLDAIASALQEPARPLFLGRKPCLPSRSLYGGFIEAPDALTAVILAPNLEDAESDPWLIVRDRRGIPENFERLHVTDERDWVGGVHAGERVFRRGRRSMLSGMEQATKT